MGEGGNGFIADMASSLKLWSSSYGDHGFDAIGLGKKGGNDSQSQLSTVDLGVGSSCLLHHPPPILCLSPKASPPSFSKNPLKALLKARSGSDVALECKPQASPRAISLWKKSNEIVQKNER